MTRFLLHAAMTVALGMAAALIAASIGPFELAGYNLVLRSQRGMTHDFPTQQARFESPDVTADDEKTTRPRNVILFIGDGMGVGQLSAASAILHGPAGSLVVETAPVTGLVRTHADNDLVTDSAASATAMATGFKAPRRSISVLSDGSEPITLFEAAQMAGLAVGVVTTSGLIDATPAAFLAHASNRYNCGEIFQEMLQSGAEVLIGGDWTDYSKATRDDSYMDMLARVDVLATASGYRLVRTGDDLTRNDGPVLALYPPRGSGGDAHGPELETTTMFAIDALSRGGQGFILLVESEVTDGAGHDAHMAGVVGGIAELDSAIAAALEWSEAAGDTLVLVTADHDTGGVGIVRGRYQEGRAKIRWATDDHTSQWVPIFAFGLGAELFAGVFENTRIGPTIAALLDLEGFPSRDRNTGG
jgi:alkaline phosphatase